MFVYRSHRLVNNKTNITAPLSRNEEKADKVPLSFKLLFAMKAHIVGKIISSSVNIYILPATLLCYLTKERHLRER